MKLDTASISTRKKPLLSFLRQQSIRNRKSKQHTSRATTTLEEIRVKKDLAEISDSKWCARGTSVTIDLNDTFHSLRCTISPVEGPYRGGQFSFLVTIPTGYPYIAPVITACHTMFHPNIDLQTRSIGLSLVDLHWSACWSLNDALFALQLLFVEPNIIGITGSVSHAAVRGNWKPEYAASVRYASSGTMECIDNENGAGLGGEERMIRNMEAAVLLRDKPLEFEVLCQKTIRGDVRLFGTNWQCVERKRLRRNGGGRRGGVNTADKKGYYDPGVGSQSFTLNITKQCSVLGKRRRRKSESVGLEQGGDEGRVTRDVFAMGEVQEALKVAREKEDSTGAPRRKKRRMARMAGMEYAWNREGCAGKENGAHSNSVDSDIDM